MMAAFEQQFSFGQQSPRAKLTRQLNGYGMALPQSRSPEGFPDHQSWKEWNTACRQ
jgi:hypothetical protein